MIHAVASWCLRRSVCSNERFKTCQSALALNLLTARAACAQNLFQNGLYANWNFSSITYANSLSRIACVLDNKTHLGEIWSCNFPVKSFPQQKPPWQNILAFASICAVKLFASATANALAKFQLLSRLSSRLFASLSSIRPQFCSAKSLFHLDAKLCK